MLLEVVDRKWVET